MLEAIRVQLGNLEETIGQLHFMSVDGQMPTWEQLRDEISALDSIADVMRSATEEIGKHKK